MLGRLDIKLGCEDGYGGDGDDMYLMIYRKELSTVRFFFARKSVDVFSKIYSNIEFILFSVSKYSIVNQFIRRSGHRVGYSRTYGESEDTERKGFRVFEIVFRERLGYDIS